MGMVPAAGTASPTNRAPSSSKKKEIAPREWPGVPSLTWELEIWGKDPEVEEGGETLIAWGGLGKAAVPG